MPTARDPKLLLEKLSSKCLHTSTPETFYLQAHPSLFCFSLCNAYVRIYFYEQMVSELEILPL